MRKLALILLPLALLSFSCANFTWKGQGGGLTSEQQQRGIKDVAELTREYETATYWQSVRARRDGRVNAWGLGLRDLQNTLDKHVFGYSPTDPYVNYPTESNLITETGRFGLAFFAR